MKASEARVKSMEIAAKTVPQETKEIVECALRAVEQAIQKGLTRVILAYPFKFGVLANEYYDLRRIGGLSGYHPESSKQAKQQLIELGYEVTANESTFELSW